ncbi:MAG: 3-deoxy-8-phosphooctulonate synthase, partial [Prevotellaceae bacterium]|nr:3-deoxy-8-phosphooctulonate synthase [Prevotellaceae bacterium]
MLLNIPKIKHTEYGNFFLIAGPCVIENEEMAMEIAEKAVRITNHLRVPYIFKGSFRKANRSRIDAFTGIGDEEALRILKKVGDTFNVPTITDVHSVEDVQI